MTKPIYEEHTSEMGYKSIKRTDSDGTIWWIPSDPANSDYQRYLRWLENPNEVEHLTEIPTN
jgi:hypothetical protein